MAKIYISDTRLDLAAECAAVKSWLTDAGYEAVDSYIPDSQPVLKSCLADIDDCDLYVLILGHRYGFSPQEKKILKTCPLPIWNFVMRVRMENPG